MKNKNKPRKQQKKPINKPKREKPVNIWVCKYFDLNGNGIESKNEKKDV